MLPIAVVLLAVLAGCGARPEEQKAGKHPEELVYVRSADEVVSGGVLFAPPRESAKPLAVIWIHGWGTNFYSPTYVGIGRALAGRGYATISANTRMHDIGNVAAWRGDRRVRGGGYWGVASEEVRDLAAWIEFAGKRGFGRVVLAGHSAGWSAVRLYQAQTQNGRVAGVVLASGSVRGDLGPADAEQLAEAKRLMDEGRGEDLVRIRGRTYPSFISAATFLDSVNAAREYKDFFGMETANPGVMRVRCPLLGFFGTRGDVGGEADLEAMAAAIRRHGKGPSRVQTAMIAGADHMYTGKEDAVAALIADWADSL